MNASAEPTLTASEIESKVIFELRGVYDPEIPVDIYELGLVYKVEVREDSSVLVQMTLTSPACPVAGSLPMEVETRIRSIPGVSDCVVELVWEPQWTPDRMSEAAKLELGFD